MGIIDIFESVTADFEIMLRDNNWSRLEKHLAEDATYFNVGGPDPKVRGRAAILDYLGKDVSNSDRRFDTRTLIALMPSIVNGNRLSLRWCCTHTLAETSDFGVERKAKYLFEGDRIKEIAKKLTAERF